LKTRTLSHRQSGFTLLEIMLVVTIIALLLAAAIYGLRGNLGFAQDTRVDADVKATTTQLNLYQAMNGFYPTTEQGLKALVTPPDSEPKPRQWRQLLSKVPIDPWGNPYIYVTPGKHNPDTFDIYSAGPDRKADTADDVGNWEK
jgi:general secretion pathway protein G